MKRPCPSARSHKENKHERDLRDIYPQDKKRASFFFIFILMRILLNALVELVSAAVDLEKDLFYLGSCHWSKGIQQSLQIRSD